METKILRTCMISFVLFALFLLCVLTGFEITPVTNGNDDLVTQHQADTQISRGEYIEVQVLSMAYRDNQALEIGNLQSTLPAFEQVQFGILHGNAAYGLSGNPPDSVKAILASQVDYANIINAISHILANPDKVPDPIQVNIIAMHTQPYLVQMSQVSALLQQDAEARKLQVLLIKLGIITAVAAAIVIKYTLFTRSILDRINHPIQEVPVKLTD